MDPSAPDFLLFNWTGFGLGILATIAIGFAWYARWSPTGKAWIRLSGVDASQRPSGRQVAASMSLMVLGSALMMFVFAHDSAVYLDAFRNVASGGKANYHLSAMDGAVGGFFTWLGFIVPLNLNAVAFERKPWALFFVNVGYYLVSLVVAGILIATVGGK